MPEIKKKKRLEVILFHRVAPVFENVEGNQAAFGKYVPILKITAKKIRDFTIFGTTIFFSFYFFSNYIYRKEKFTRDNQCLSLSLPKEKKKGKTLRGLFFFRVIHNFRTFSFGEFFEFVKFRILSLELSLQNSTVAENIKILNFLNFFKLPEAKKVISCE